jgi:predicted nucleic acid-binding protein
MAHPLDAAPDGSDVLIDANVLIYGLTARSAQCKAFLERCSREELTGITLFEAVNNATHQFMKGEALQKGLCAGQAKNYLSAHPEQVRRLTDYWVNTQRLLALNLLFVPVERDIVTGAQTERVNAGLLTNDSIIVAAMREYGISLIATNDRQFDAVAGITVFSATDVP